MNEDNVLSEVVDIVLDKPSVIKVEVQPKNRLHRKLIGWGVLAKHKVYEIRGTTLGTMLAISNELLGLKNIERDQNMIAYHIENIASKADKAAYIIALAIHNRPGEPGKKLTRFIRNNFDSKDFQRVFFLVLQKLNMSDFSNTITLIERVNILKEVSPMEEPEIIAAQTEIPSEQLEELQNIFAGANTTSSGE